MGATQVEPKFNLGQTFITALARELLDDDQVQEMLTRHVSGDWGDLDEHDRAMNDRAVESGRHRILSRFDVGRQIFYVITEWDRSLTTVLRSEDY